MAKHRRKVDLEKITSQNDSNLDPLWLSKETEAYFTDLRSVLHDVLPDARAKELYARVHESCALGLAPLVDEEAAIKYLLALEMGKPVKPEQPRKPRNAGLTDRTEAISRLVDQWDEDGNILFPDDTSKDFIKGSIVQTVTSALTKERHEWNKEWGAKLAQCMDIENVKELCKILVSIVNTKTKIISPLDDERYSAHQMEESAFLTETLFEHLKDDIPTYWKIAKTLNYHWGRQALLSRREEMEKLARQLGQLGEDERLP